MTDPPILSDQLVSGHAPLPAIARAIFDVALADCSIARAFARSVRVVTAPDGARRLLLGHDDNDSIDITHTKHVRVIAIGKAAGSMLQAILPRLSLPAWDDLQGVLIAPSSPSSLPTGFQFFAGGHPLPNEASFAGARAVLTLLKDIPKALSSPPASLCLFLISGGASAMMELPLDPAISLDDTIAFHRALVHSGASIAEINCVRKHFSAVKGGRLATAAHGAACVSLFVSDVPSGHLDTIASGPTVPDNSTLEDCRTVLARYHLLDRFPASVQRFFTGPTLPETPKPHELTARTLTLLDAADLAEAARQRAEHLGFHAVIDNTCDDWDYRAAADYLLARLRVLRRSYPRVCLISAGEVTVSSADSRLIASGVGGRNQHFALYAATRIEASDAPLAVLSGGSDGIDGNSTAAGAVVDEHTLQDAHLRSEARTALLQFHSAAILQSLGATMTTGPTGNNLRDLRLLLTQ